MSPPLGAFHYKAGFFGPRGDLRYGRQSICRAMSAHVAELSCRHFNCCHTDGGTATNIRCRRCDLRRHVVARQRLWALNSPPSPDASVPRVTTSRLYATITSANPNNAALGYPIVSISQRRLSGQFAPGHNGFVRHRPIKLRCRRRGSRSLGTLVSRRISVVPSRSGFFSLMIMQRHSQETDADALVADSSVRIGYDAARFRVPAVRFVPAWWRIRKNASRALMPLR